MAANSPRPRPQTRRDQYPAQPAQSVPALDDGAGVHVLGELVAEALRWFRPAMERIGDGLLPSGEDTESVGYRIPLVLRPLEPRIMLSVAAPAVNPDIERVNVAADGTQAEQRSSFPDISPDGGFASFHSSSQNLVPNDTNNQEDIFVVDRQTGGIQRASLAHDGSEATGNSYWSSLSQNGQYVAFDSYASNLVPNDTNDIADVFVRDLLGETTERVSVKSDGSQSNAGTADTTYGCYEPKITPDGRYVTFSSHNEDLVPNDTNDLGDAFVHDRQSGVTERVSLDSNGQQLGLSSYQPSISGDGRFVAFLSEFDLEETTYVHVKDRQTGELLVINGGANGEVEPFLDSGPPWISTDGRFVTFCSFQEDLAPNDTNGHGDVFVYEMQTGAMERVSMGHDGSEGDDNSEHPAISGTGRLVTFHADATNLVPNDTNGFADVFLHDRQTGTTARITMGHDGSEANASSSWSWPRIDDSGSWGVFVSEASNLVPDDTNHEQDVFVYPAREYPKLLRHTPTGMQYQPVSAMWFDFNEAMDQNSFDPAQDVASFTGPGGVGAIPVTGSSWIDSGTLEVTFAQQTVDGEYEMTLGPSILDLQGNPLDQDGDFSAGDVPNDQYTGAFSLNLRGPRVTSQTPTGIVSLSVSLGVSAVELGFSEPVDPSSFSIGDDVVSFTGPSGWIPVTDSNWGDSQTLQLTFAEQTTNGQYHLVIGPQITDVGGNAMDQDQDSTFGEDPDDRYSGNFELRAGPYVTGHTPTGDVVGPVSQVDVTFNESVAEGTFTLDDVQIVGPSGAITGTPTRMGSIDYHIRFDPQNGPGAYHVYVGPQIENLFGLLMDQDRDGVLGEATADRYDATFTILDVDGPRVTSHQPQLPTNQPLSQADFIFNEDIDLTSFTVADVAIDGPGGAVVPTSVTPTDPTTFRVAFPQQTAEGTYNVTIGPSIADPAGNFMDQDQDDQKNEPTDDQYTAQLTIDLTRPQVASHTPVGIQYVPVDSFRLQFDEAIDPTTFPVGVVHVTGPNGPVPATDVNQLAPNLFEVTIPSTPAEGTFNVAIDPVIGDLAGNVLAAPGYAFDFVQLFPDLVVTQVLWPQEARAGQDVDVQWTVTNRGEGVATGAWHDVAVFSTDPVLGNDEQLVELRLDSAPNGLAPGASYTRATTATVPANATGDAWLFVTTDSDTEITESNEQNNTTMGDQALSVTTRPYPDLQVTEVNGPAKLRSGDFATVSWKTQNFGTGSTTAPGWHDGVYLSSDNFFDQSDVLLDSAQNPDFLGTGEFYTQTLEVTIPSDATLGSYYLFVKADRDDVVEEFDLEGNNTGMTVNSIDLVSPGPAILTVTDIQGPATIEPGDMPEITWTITNTGDSTITTGSSGGTGWDDGLALSQDQTYSEAEDYFWGSHIYWQGLPLRPDESYTSTGTPERGAPAWVPGTYYIIVLPDTHFGAGSTAGNSTIARDYGVEPVQLVVSKPPDLIVTNLTAPAQATSGLDMDISWTVLNNGPGQTHTTSWSDAVYLSTDQVLDGGDLLVGSEPHEGELFSGGSYSQPNVQMEVPRGIGGNYYLIVHTDYETKVYESDDANNTRASDAVIPIALIQSDLVPVIDTSPTAGLAGQTIDVTRTVQNAGADTTALGAWTDTFYLSTDAVLNTTDDTKIGDVTYDSGALASGGSYQELTSLSIPRGTAGTFYLFLTTDSADALYEHNGENNNTAVAANQIQIQDLAPDLNIVTFTTPATAIAGRTLDLTGSIRNDGTYAAPASWDDVVYLSSDSVLGKDQDTKLDTFVRSQDVPIGQAYEPQHSPFEVQLPDGIAGDYYLFLVVDDSGVLYEKGATGNNTAVTGPITVTDLKPDLVVQSATAPATGTANQVIDVNFLIGNPGEEPATGKWFDGFYLSADTTFDPNTDTLFGAFEHNQDVAVNDTYGPPTNPAQARLPDRIDGQYRIFVLPDYTNKVPELNDADAYLIPTPIDITYLPADLQVTALTAPTSATAGAPINVNITVTNAGLAATTELNWQDGVYLSTDLTFDPAGDIELGLIAHQGRLNASGAYSVSRSYTLPQHLDGTYHLYTFTDARRQVYEHDLEGNNKTAADAMTVTRVEADLQVTTLNVPAAGATGDTIQVDWTVTNLGADTTAALSFSDRVYLSTDNVLDANDSVLATFRHDGALASGASYNMSRNVTLSTDVVGSLFVIVKTDAAATNEVYEYQAEGNNTASAPIDVTYAPSPDLQVASVVAPATAWSGQNLHLEWTVNNAGDATASAMQGGWYDSAYLSRDIYLDRNTDVYLGSVLYPGTLASSAQYASPLALDARLDPGLSGPYYVLVGTDSNDRVLERAAETNNTGVSASLLQVDLTPPSDLQVTDITVPAPAIYGAEVDWTYQVTNQDTLDAFGSWYDTVYLSVDDQWDLNDGRIGRVQHVGDVPHAASYSETLTANVPGLVPGDYYVIVRTDIRDDLRELDETNNTGVSATTFTVEGRELTPGLAAAGTLAVGQSAYYEVNVGAGEDLRVTLTGDAASGAELYVANGYVPTRSTHEARGTSSSGSDPQVRIPGTQVGPYYLLVYARHAGTGTGYELTANLLDAAVTAVTPNAGGNTGKVTVLIEGDSLPEGADASLISPTGTTVPASRVWAGDSSGFYATFNLTGQAPGLYDVAATGANAYVSGNDLFTVQSGGGADFQAELLVSAVVRPNAPQVIEVQYSNDGNIDIPSPVLTLTGPDYLGMGLESGDYIATGYIQFMAYSSTGPAGILQPGDTERVQLFTSGVNQPVSEYVLTSLKVDPSNPTPELIDWDGLSSQFQPPYLTDAEWDPIWTAFTRELGATWPEVAAHLSQQLTDKPHHSMPNILVEDLMQDALRATNGQNGGGMTDTTPPRVMTHLPTYLPTGSVMAIDLLFSEMLDLTTFTPDDVIVTDPLGVVVPLTGLDPVNDRLWRLAFDPQAVPGVFDVTVGPDILDPNGFALDQDWDGQPGEPLDDRYSADFMVFPGGGVTTSITSLSPTADQMQLDDPIVNFSQPIHFQTFTPSDVTIIGPGGPVPVADITQLTSTSFQLNFPSQTALGDYQITISSDITDLNGNLLDANRDGTPDAAGASGFQTIRKVRDLVGLRVTEHYPGDLGTDPPADYFRLTFDEDVDPTSFTPADVTLTGPNGPIAITTVTAVDGRNFIVRFAEQNTEGRYTFAVSPNVNDLNGNPMDQNGNFISGEAGDTYPGFFDVLTSDLVVTGTVTYTNYLKDYFPNAHVAVQLWEQNGTKDPTPGLKGDDDEADKLISDWNSLSGIARGAWGSDFVTDSGTYRFHQDTAGNHIQNTDTAVTTAAELDTTADFYVVVMAKNKYAMATDWRRGALEAADPWLRFFHYFYPKGKPEHAPPYRDIYQQIFFETTPITQPAVGSILVTINPVVTKDEFGLSEWVYYGANWIKSEIEEDPRRFIALSAYQGDPDNAMYRWADYICVGDEYLKSPQTLLHEYGHAVQGSFVNYRAFPYGEGPYGIVQLGSTMPRTMAEAWAVFFAAKTLEPLDISAYLANNLEKNRQAKWFETNDFWMSWDGYYLFFNNNHAHDSLFNAADLADAFRGVNYDHNTGHYVLGATTSIFWDLADGTGDDKVNDLKGLWKAVKETSATNTIDAFYAKYKANEGGNAAADNAMNAIFIDHGIPVADDTYEENDAIGEVKVLAGKKPPFEITHLVMAEAEAGKGDWYRLDVAKATGGSQKERKYDLTVGIEFEKRYGDLDLFVWAVDGGGVDVLKQYEINCDTERETIKIPNLSNLKTYQVAIGVAGGGAYIPTAPGGWDFDRYGGDMNPDYRLFVQGKVPDTNQGGIVSDADQGKVRDTKGEKEEDRKEQGTAGDKDPNDKLAPGGFGDGHYIPEGTVLPYTIRFENDPEATASSVLVTVTDQLDADLDWTTFELGDIQFSNHLIDVPEGLTYFETIYDLRPEGNDLLVEIVADFDVNTGQVQWTLTALDPATGELTYDPFAGFLPPNDPEVHDGEGFVKCSVQPQAGLPSGSEIRNDATIIFGWNEPMDTPPVLNTIDSAAPTSAVDALPATTNTSSFQVTWIGADDAGGSGVANFDVYVSDNGGPFELWLQDTTATRGWYDGEDGHTYSFYSRALDNVGHQEGEKLAAEATTQLDVRQAQRVLAPDRGSISHSITYIDGDGDLVTVTFTAEVGSTATLTRRIVDWDDQGDLFSIDISGNDDRMSIDIHVQESGDVLDYGTTLGSVFGDELWRFHAPQVDMVGNTIVLTGPLHWLTLRDIEDGSDITLGGNADDRLTLHARDVGDVDLVFPGILWQAIVEEWTGGEIRVNYIVDLRATDGDFGADLMPTGADALGYSLSSADIAGDLDAATWTLPGSARRIHVQDDASTDLDLTGDLGWMFTRTRGGQRRWYAQGLWVGGNLSVDVDVDVDAIRIDVSGDVSGNVDVGDDVGVAYRRRSGSTVRWIATGFTSGGNLTGDFQAGGNVVRMDVHGDVGGAVDITGDLGVAVRERSRNSTRWITRGLWCGGDVTGDLGVGGNVVRMDVTGDVGGNVNIAGQLGARLRNRSPNRTRWITTGFWCGSNVTGNVQVDGDAVRMDVDGNVAGNVDVTGQLGTRLKRRSGGSTRWLTTGLAVEGDLDGDLTVGAAAVRVDVEGNVDGGVDITGNLGVWMRKRSPNRSRWTATGMSVGGDLTGSFNARADVATMNVDGDVTGTVDVTGDLGARRREIRGGRRRWSTTGLRTGGSVSANVTVVGAAAIIDIDVDLASATVSANDLGQVVVDGRITSVGAQLIRSLLVTSRFYVSDSTWSGTISGAAGHVFDGAVTAQIG